MTSPRSVIFRRHLSRLRSNRSVALGLILGATFLALMVTVIVAVHRQTGDKGDFAAEFQHDMWGPRSDVFGVLVVIFAIVVGSSMVNDDLKAGTIFGVLARPVSRTDYFAGSWLGAATFLVGLHSMQIVLALGAAVVLKGPITSAYLLAIVAAVSGELLTLTMFAAAGAVVSTAVSLLLGISAILIAGLAFGSNLPAWAAYPLRVVAVVLPLNGHQNAVVERSLLGESRAVVPLVEIVAYRLCWTAALFVAGAWGFSRREISPRT